MKIKIFLLLIILTSLTSGFALYKSKSTLPEKLIQGKGKKIYTEYGCVNCHGSEGKGNGSLSEFLKPKPRNFTSLKEMKSLPDSLMMYSIKHGVLGAAMPAHPDLTETQINDLVIYLRQFLADYYHTVNMCATDKHIVDLKEVFNTYEIDIYDSRKISAEINEDSLIINAMSPIHLINEMNKKNTRTVRNRVRITKDTGDKEEIILITVRVHDCIRGKV
jgi:mono/diheme cytochrome c family protein